MPCPKKQGRAFKSLNASIIRNSLSHLRERAGVRGEKVKLIASAISFKNIACISLAEACPTVIFDKHPIDNLSITV